MENQPTNVEELFEKVKDYAETRIDLFKLKTVNKVSGFLSNLITTILLVSLLFLVLIFLFIGLALLIGSWIGQAYFGFLIMAALFIIIGLVLYSVKGKILKTPISNSLIKSLID
ncbi:MAG: phage holin family protein [Ginsengibacter sp.]